MRSSPAELSRRAADVLRRDGVFGAASRSLAWLGRLVYEKNDFLIFDHDLRPTDFTPRASNFTVTAICSPGDLGRLPESVRNALDPIGRRLRPHMETRGMIYCVVVDGKLAHQCWVGTQRSDLIDPIGAHLNYDRLAYLGAGETLPAFRGQGMLPLVLCEICKTLKSRGFLRAMATVSPSNSPSIRGITKAGFQPAGRGKLTRCLGRSSWIQDPPAGRKER